MHPQRKKRLILVLGILVSVSLAAGLAGFALQQNINLYFTPLQVQKGLAPDHHDFRLGGLVKENSIYYEDKGAVLHFVLTDRKHEIPVVYRGIVPDLFGPNQGIVAQGQLKNGRFVASEVLAKHGAKYMPREVMQSLQQGR